MSFQFCVYGCVIRGLYLHCFCLLTFIEVLVAVKNMVVFVTKMTHLMMLKKSVIYTSNEYISGYVELELSYQSII